MQSKRGGGGVRKARKKETPGLHHQPEQSHLPQTQKMEVTGRFASNQTQKSGRLSSQECEEKGVPCEQNTKTARTEGKVCRTQKTKKTSDPSKKDELEEMPNTPLGGKHNQ